MRSMASRLIKFNWEQNLLIEITAAVDFLSNSLIIEVLNVKFSKLTFFRLTRRSQGQNLSDAELPVISLALRRKAPQFAPKPHMKPQHGLKHSAEPASFSHVLFNGSYGGKILKILFLILTPSLLVLLVGCGKGVRPKTEVSALVGEYYGDKSYQTNELVGKNKKFEEFISKEEDTETLFTTPQAYGKATAGSLKNATYLPEEGEGFIASPSHRKKHFSTLELQKIITFGAKFVLDKNPKSAPVVIGNLSKQNGGVSGSHVSHQNGIDADIFYYPIVVTTLSPDMVLKNKVSKNFDAAKNYSYIKSIIETGRVRFVLVHSVIKQALCLQAGLQNESTTDNEVLRRILTDKTDHKDHMHVRIFCPWNSIGTCENQWDIKSTAGTECEVFKPTLNFKE